MIESMASRPSVTDPTTTATALGLGQPRACSLLTGGSIAAAKTREIIASRTMSQTCFSSQIRQKTTITRTIVRTGSSISVIVRSGGSCTGYAFSWRLARIIPFGDCWLAVATALDYRLISSDGHPLVGTSWPVPASRATVVIAHGINEHIGRYAHVAAALNRAGYSVVGVDHRGHGRSDGGSRGRPTFAASTSSWTTTSPSTMSSCVSPADQLWCWVTRWAD